MISARSRTGCNSRPTSASSARAPPGIAIAREFADSDLRVLLLESGGLRRKAGVDDLNEGETSGIDPASLTDGRGRLFGGATALWAGQCLTPDPMTFEQRDWVSHSGWPLTAAELEPFERRAEALFQIGGEPYDEEVWDGFGVERPAVDPERVVHRFSVWCPEPNLGRLYRPLLSSSSSVRVLLNATVTEVATTPGGDRFQSVRALTPEGKEVRIDARACVLCGGGIENARLLLDSDSTHRGGVGNAGDQVGRYFQDHPNVHAAVIHDGDVPRLQELYGLLYRGRIRYLPRLVLSPATQRSQEVLSCAAHPVFHFGEDSGIEAARRLYRAARGGHPPRELPAELWRIARDAPRLLPGGLSACHPRSLGAGGSRAGDPADPRRAGAQPRQPGDPVGAQGRTRPPAPASRLAPDRTGPADGGGDGAGGERRARAARPRRRAGGAVAGRPRVVRARERLLPPHGHHPDGHRARGKRRRSRRRGPRRRRALRGRIVGVSQPPGSPTRRS